MTEHWELIEGYDDYEVSTLGRVRQVGTGHGRTQGRILKPVVNQNGYIKCSLTTDGRKKDFLSHRLVGYAFCEPPNNWESLDINHKNGIRTDNRADNLEWCTRSENMIHARDVLGTVQLGEGCHRAKLTEPQVLEIRQRYTEGGITQHELGAKYGISRGHVSDLVLCKKWRHI